MPPTIESIEKRMSNLILLLCTLRELTTEQEGRYLYQLLQSIKYMYKQGYQLEVKLVKKEK